MLNEISSMGSVKLLRHIAPASWTGMDRLGAMGGCHEMAWAQWTELHGLGSMGWAAPNLLGWVRMGWVGMGLVDGLG